MDRLKAYFKNVWEVHKKFIIWTISIIAVIAVIAALDFWNIPSILLPMNNIRWQFWSIIPSITTLFIVYFLVQKDNKQIFKSKTILAAYMNKNIMPMIENFYKEIDINSKYFREAAALSYDCKMIDTFFDILSQNLSTGLLNENNQTYSLKLLIILAESKKVFYGLLEIYSSDSKRMEEAENYYIKKLKANIKEALKHLNISPEF